MARARAATNGSAVAGEVLSLFSGIGGLDLGARLAGLNVARSTDIDATAIDVLKDALGTATTTADITESDADEFLSKLGLGGAGEIRYVIGGPPCTAFSHAGFWLEDKRKGEDPAASLLDNFVEIVRAAKPDAFVMENVPGLLFKTHQTFFKRLIERTRRAGYSVSWEVLKASSHGVAQARRRLFVVGVRGGPPFKFPSGAAPTRSAAWAIQDLEDRTDLAEPDENPNGEWGKLLPKVPPGGNYLHFTKERGCKKPLFAYRGRYWSFLLKTAPDRPSPTIPAQRVTYNGPFHWHNRHLRVREMARLQGFPDWYPLATHLPTARRHIGNAVPPPLAATVIWGLRRHLGEVSTTARPDVLESLQDPGLSFDDFQSEIARP